VVPIYSDVSKTTFVGELDIDSPVVNGFDEEDAAGLEKLMELLGSSCDWTNINPSEAVHINEGHDPSRKLACPISQSLNNPHH